YSDAVLILGGTGEEFDSIQDKAKHLNLNDNIIFTGSTSEIPDLMQAMDVFIFPSIYEGLGIVAIEAQSAGLPTIVSENIPKEAYLTDLIYKISLSQSPTV